MIKITFSNPKDVAGIYYQGAKGFVGKLYLDADLGKPTYTYEEEGDEDTLGNFDRSYARVSKQYTVTTHLQEYMIDALSVIQLHDDIYIVASNGAAFKCIDFKMSEPSWEDTVSAFALVTLTFTVYTETIFTRC